MDSSAPENNFTQAIVMGIRHRFVQRLQGRQPRLHPSRKNSWSYTLIRNRSKLKPRLKEPLRERRRRTGWEHAIAKQQVRMYVALDPYTRWVNRERSIQEQVNAGHFEQIACYSKGFAWAFTAAKQVTKLERHRFPVRITPRVRRLDWEGAQRRAWSEYKRLLQLFPEQPNPWEAVVKGTTRKFNQRLDVLSDWASRMAQRSRRWSSEKQ